MKEGKLVKQQGVNKDFISKRFHFLFFLIFIKDYGRTIKKVPANSSSLKRPKQHFTASHCIGYDSRRHLEFSSPLAPLNNALPDTLLCYFQKTDAVSSAQNLWLPFGTDQGPNKTTENHRTADAGRSPRPNSLLKPGQLEQAVQGHVQLGVTCLHRWRSHSLFSNLFLCLTTLSVKK